jgi:hypothetical protein
LNSYLSLLNYHVLLELKACQLRHIFPGLYRSSAKILLFQLIPLLFYIRPLSNILIVEVIDAKGNVISNVCRYKDVLFALFVTLSEVGL